MSKSDEKINEIPNFLKEMCSELTEPEQLEAYERLMEFMEIAWRIHVRLTSEQDALTESESSIGSGNIKQKFNRKINDDV